MKILSSFMILAGTVLVFRIDAASPVNVTEAARTPAAAANQTTDNASSPPYVSAQAIREYATRAKLKLRSHVGLVFDERDNEIIYARNADEVMPVASLSKLMTAMVILDAELSMDEVITISAEDKDRIRYSRSRLRTGMQFTRNDLLLISLAASENRAAMALARTYPGGNAAFVKAMNQKARQLDMTKTQFADPSGLHNENVSTATELVKLVKAASQYRVIREFSTQTKESIVDVSSDKEVKFGNTNRLVKRDSWPITLSKTGFTDDAGNCLVMQTEINDRPVVIVLLESWGKLSKYGDSNRIKQWLTKVERIAEKNTSSESI